MSFRNVDPRLLRERHDRVPQLRDYDRLEPHVHSYVGLAAGRDIRTARVTTDANGFRRTPAGTQIIDTGTPPEQLDGVVLGGSFTFGVGASSDAETVVAHVAASRGERWLNLGIRAGNSTQEVAAALPFVLTVPRVVIVSGANNLIAALQTEGGHEVYGPMFFERALDAVATVPVHDLVEFVERRGGRRFFRRGRASTGPAKAETALTASLAERLQLALDRQVRDLTILVRLVGDPLRVLFCAQPFADGTDRAHVPEERGLLGLHDRRQGERWERVRQFALARWPEYVRLLAEACDALDVPFLEMPAAGFRGWSFIDRLHLTDDGYRQAAETIVEAL